MFLRVSAAAIAAALPCLAVAQSPSPVLTLSQDRLYVASEFGQRVQAELEAASQELSAENRRIEAALIDEEQRLVADRANLPAEEFRALADDFDERVTGIRRAQEQKASAIQRRADAERARFFELAFPVLLRLVEETGAVAILDNSAVIFSVRQIDITEAAIERVNAEIGAAPPEPESGPQPEPRPQREPTVEAEDAPEPSETGSDN